MNEHKKTDPASLPWLGRKLLWLDDMGNVKRLYQGLIAVCVLLFAADFIYERHGHFSFEHLWGFYGLFGFIAFSIVIFGSKALRVLIKRDETYYSPHVIDGEDYPEDGIDIAEHHDE